MTKPDKSQLLKEIEKGLRPNDYDYERSQNTAFILDVMGAIRRTKCVKIYVDMSF